MVLYKWNSVREKGPAGSIHIYNFTRDLAANKVTFSFEMSISNVNHRY